MLRVRVVSQPEKELGGRHPHTVRELYLGHRGIQKLAGFEEFAYLNDLYLEHNEIVKLRRGLSPLTRLTTLSVHHNALRSISGAFRNMPCLEVLLLHANALRGLDEVVSQLGKLKYLHTLTLFANPVEEELNYRSFVIASCPSLHTFDRKAISLPERKHAAKKHPSSTPSLPPLPSSSSSPHALSASPRSLMASRNSRHSRNSHRSRLSRASRASRTSRTSRGETRTPLYLRSGVGTKKGKDSGGGGGRGRRGRERRGHGESKVAFWTTAKPLDPPPPPHCRPHLVVDDLHKRVAAIHAREEAEEMEELTKMFEEQTRQEILDHRRSRTVPLPKSLDFLAARRAGQQAQEEEEEEEESKQQTLSSGPGSRSLLPGASGRQSTHASRHTPPPTPFVYKLTEWITTEDEGDSPSSPSPPPTSGATDRHGDGEQQRLSSLTTSSPRLLKRSSLTSSFARLNTRDAIVGNPAMFAEYQARKSRKSATPVLRQATFSIQ